MKKLFQEFGITKERFLQALSTVRGTQRVVSDHPEAPYDTLDVYKRQVEDLLQKSEEFLFYPECHNIMDVARYRLEHKIEFSALSEKGKKYFNLEAYAHELEEKGR